MNKIFLLSLILLSFMLAAAQNPPSESQKANEEVVRLFQAKKYDEALPLAKKAIALTESEFGRQHAALAAAWRNLAYIEMNAGNRKEAREAFEKALSIYKDLEKPVPNEQRLFAEMLESVAVYEAIDGNYSGAEKKLLKAVELRETAGGKDSPDIAYPLMRLAEIYRLQNEYEKAEPLLARALEVKTKNTDKLDDLSKKVYDNLLCINAKLDRGTENENLRKRFFPNTGTSSGTIKGGVVNGKALNLVKPPYPREAREQRASGAVSVQVLISEKGEVLTACAVSGSRLLHRVTEAAAFQSKFSPTTLSGQPVKVSGIITYNFSF